MGDSMDQRIDVLGIDIDSCTAKEALRKTIGYMDSVPISTVEMLTVDGLMQMGESPEIKEEVCKFDLVMAGDKTLLEAADITEHKILRSFFCGIFIRITRESISWWSPRRKDNAFLIICKGITKAYR